MKNILYVTKDEASTENDNIHSDMNVEFIILKDLENLFTYLSPQSNEIIGIFIDFEIIELTVDNKKISVHDIVHTISTINSFLNLDIKTAIGIAPNVSTANIKEVLGINEIAGLYPQGPQVSINEKNTALKEILLGNGHIPLSIKKKLKNNKKLSLRDDNKIKLTPRQSQILNLLVNRGSSNKSIARILKISESTVKLHMTAILKKFGCQNRLQLALSCKDNYILN